MSRPRGITLFEILITVLVIGFVALVAVPPIYQAQQNVRFSAVTHRVRSVLHQTRILSVVRNQDCRFRVVSRTTYLIECQTPAWKTVETHSLPVDFEISANSSPEFHPRGNVGPMGTIRLWNTEGDQKRVIVSRSGRVRTE